MPDPPTIDGVRLLTIERVNGSGNVDQFGITEGEARSLVAQLAELGITTSLRNARELKPNIEQ